LQFPAHESVGRHGHDRCEQSAETPSDRGALWLIAIIPRQTKIDDKVALSESQDRLKHSQCKSTAY